MAQTPAFVKFRLKALAELAGRGDGGSAEEVTRLLAEHPELRAEVPELADLTARAVAAWVRAASGRDALAAEAAGAEAARMQADLLGPGAGVLERVLAGALV